MLKKEENENVELQTVDPSAANCSEVEISCQPESSLIKNAREDDLSFSPEFERDVWKMSPEELRPAMNGGTFDDSMCCTCSMPEKVKYKRHDSDENSKDVSKNSNGENSGAKCKPLFRPGFLVKQPWKEYDAISPDGNAKKFKIVIGDENSR